MDLVGRVKNILLSPKTEWPVIEQEQTDIKTVYMTYILILAAIPAIAGIIASMLIGGVVGSLAGRFGMGVGVGGGFAVAHAIAGYVIALVMVLAVAFIIDALAPTFGGQKNLTNAVKLVAYAATAGWVASIAVIIPVLGWIVAFVGSLYGIYLLYLGLPILMKCPGDKTVVYLIVSIIVWLVLAWILNAVVIGGMFGTMMLGR